MHLRGVLAGIGGGRIVMAAVLARPMAAEQLLDTRLGKVPRRFLRAPHLSESCPEVVQHDADTLPREPRIGPSFAMLGKGWEGSTNIDQNLTNIGHGRLTSAKFGPTCLNCGQLWPAFSKGSKLAGVHKTCADSQLLEQLVGNYCACLGNLPPTSEIADIVGGSFPRRVAGNWSASCG